jgi:hypothetical protein
MAQFNPLEFIYHYRKGIPVYYSYNEELYCGTFPEEWASSHCEGTGPKDCKNCAFYGSWNGVFIGYCSNCAKYIYQGQRGRGLIECGVENDDEDVNHYDSIFQTYLKDIVPDDVGDKDFMDSFAALNTSNSVTNSFEDLVFDVNDEHERLPFELLYPDIDINEVNADYDEMCRQENEMCDDCGVGIGYSYSSAGEYYIDYDGGYDSY